MLDRPDPGVDRPLRPRGGLHVPGHLEAGLGRLADEELDLLGGVPPALAVDADLDDSGAEERVLPDRLDDLVVRVGFEVFRIDDLVVQRHRRRRRELAAHPADDQAGGDHRRPRQPPCLDRLAERHVGVVGVVAEVTHDGKAAAQHLEAVGGGLDRAQLRRFLDVGDVVVVPLRVFLVGQREVVVRIDEARHHRELRQVNHLGTRRHRHVRADGGEAPALDEDDGVPGDRTVRRIDQAAGADRGDRTGRRRRRGPALGDERDRRHEQREERKRPGQATHGDTPGGWRGGRRG